MSTPKHRPGLSNCSNKIALSISDIIEQVTAETAGWPKMISDSLCYRHEKELRPLPSSQALFAFLDRFFAVQWTRHGPTKEEFFEGLKQQAEAYAWASSEPHFPPIPGVYYLTKPPKPKDNGRLDQLVDRFAPATPHDKQLLKALFITAFWGGPPGQRPAFIITTQQGVESNNGVGVGKSTLANKVAKLAGGEPIHVRKGEQDKIPSLLQSPKSWPARILLLDNLKSYHFSSDLLESLITAPQIDGHRLYVGHSTRPNLLTVIVTINGAAFCRDMADRSIVIHLTRPTICANQAWEREIDAFIEENRRALLANIRWHLENNRWKISSPPRWAAWHRDVLARLERPKKLMQVLKNRREGIDQDKDDAGVFIAHVEACILATCPYIKNVSNAYVQIPPPLMQQWVRSLRPDFTGRQALVYAKQIGDARFSYRRTSKERFYIYQGTNANSKEPTVLPYNPKGIDKTYNE